VAFDSAMLGNSGPKAVPPFYWVLFAPIVWSMEAYYIDTTVSHGTFTYDMSGGVVKDADIVDIDILLKSIT